MAKKQQSVTTGALAAGVGVVGAAAAVAGAYFLYGTKAGAKQVKHVRGWALKMKGEALEQLERLEDVSEKTYKGVIDRVSDEYSRYAHIDKKELRESVKELKAQWANIKKEVEKGKKTAEKEIKMVGRAIRKKS